MRDTIEMAREAGFVVCRDESMLREMLERFAELVRADERRTCKTRIEAAVKAERETCAQLCEDPWQTPDEIQDAIRARSNT